MRALGKDLDVALGINPAALAIGTATGKRIHMRNYETLGVLVVLAGASGGADDIVLTLQEHNAAAGGVSQNLSALTEYYRKNAAPLAGTEKWTEVTQVTGPTITIVGATFATHQIYVYFDVEAQSLSTGFEWLSINVSGLTGANTRIGSVSYIPTRLKIQRKPDLLAQPNA